MTNSFYNHTDGAPATQARGISQYFRSQLDAIAAGFDGVAASSSVQSQWVVYAPTATFISATSFSVAGNQTAIFQVDRRIKTVNTAGTVYGRVSASVFGAVTTVTVVNDSGALDIGLSAVSYGLLTPTNPAVPATYTKVADLAASSGSSLSGHIPAGTGAVATTVQEKMREQVSLFDNLSAAQITAYKAKTYLTDLSPALEDIITTLAAGAGGDIYLPPGGCLFDNINVPDDSRIRIFGAGAASIPKKGANGPMFTLGKQCTLEDMVINGDGATRTGTGVLASTGALDNFSWRRMRGVDIYNTASYCLEFSGNRAGYASQIENCRLVPTSTATYAIKAAGNGGVVEDNGNRMFRNIWTFGNRIADLTDANDCDFVGIHGFWPKFTATTHKCNFTGGRLNQYDANDVFTGVANVIDGITMNANGGAVLTILVGATNCRFAPSIAVGSGLTVTDQSGSGTTGTEVWLPKTTYTPTWGGTGGTPAIGNGAIGGACTRRGNTALVNMLLNIGSTTAFNTSTGWTFTVPYTASRTSTGAAYILDSGTSHFIGIAKIEASTNTVTVFRDGAGAGVGYLVPMTWANGDLLRFDIEFDIQ